MGALTGVYPVVGQPGFHDDAGRRNIRPFHRYAEPSVAATPPSRTHQYVMLTFVKEAAVELLDVVGYQLVVGGGIAFGLHIDDVLQVVHHTVSQRVSALEQELFFRHQSQVFVQPGFHIDHRTDLQQIEHAALGTGVQIDGKLDFHRTTHLALTVFLHKLEDAGQREDVVLEDVGKGDELAPAGIDAVAYHHVIRVVGRGDEVQGAVGLGIFHMELQQVEAVVEREVLSQVLQVEGIEAGLGLAQGDFHLAGLEHLRGVVRTDTQGETAVDNVFSKSQRQAHRAFFGQFVVDGIIVDRAGHTGYGRIVTVAILGANHFLKDDGHLFLVDDVASGLHVGLAILIIYGGIHTLDGIAQHAEHLVLVVQIGNHVSGIDTGKRLVVGVFQQAGRTDGNGGLDGIEEGEKVFHQTVGQLGPEESLQNHVVGGIAQGYLVQLVGVHELIEHIGTKHHGFRNHDRGVFKLVELGMTLHHVIDKGQSAPLASQRAVADTRKIGIAVETVALEHGHHALVFHLAVFHDGFENNLPVCVDVLKGFPRNLFQELGHREDGTRIQPARDVVAADVVKEGFCRNSENHVLEFFQVMDAGHFLQGMGVAEDEVAETEVVGHGFAQVDVHLLGVLVDEHGIQFGGILAVTFFGRLQNQWDERIAPAYLTQQAYPCLCIVFAFTGETGIGNDAQHVVLVLVIQVHGFLVRTG